ncbi:MAG TPA: KOW motif-containing protein [Caulobacteraceae bacterium]|nr:KOW motif-containing protein [Caulobacteraceae bacterium]
MTDAAMSYAPGDPVRVVDGPFENFIGIVRDIDADHDELLVEVTMLGVRVPIRTEPWQIARD